MKGKLTDIHDILLTRVVDPDTMHDFCGFGIRIQNLESGSQIPDLDLGV
jgi:hypothetical protein